MIFSFIYIGYEGYLGIKYNLAITIIFFVLIIFLILMLAKRKERILNNVLLKKINIVHIVLIGFILRFLWIVFVKTTPSSDFALMYNYSKLVSKGIFYGFYGHSYFARFPHDTPTVLYFALFHKILNNPLFLVKFFNVIWETLSIYLIYKVVNISFNNKDGAKVTALILAFFPPFIIYTSETMSENMAMPFYILSVFLFFKGIKSLNKKSIIYFLICGLSLTVASMLREVGGVFLIAYGIYLILYERKLLIKGFLPIIIAFIVPLLILSFTLLSFNVIEYNLWNSKEPIITSVLKGTNIEHFGMYNIEDASIVQKLDYNKGAIEKEAEEIIIKRLTTTNPVILAGFYIAKVSLQWGFGDFAAINWALKGKGEILEFLKTNSMYLNILSSIFYIFVIRRNLKNLLNNKNKLKEKNFFYILLGGFILMYIITEMQPRYAFICAWVLIIIGSLPPIGKIKD